MNAPADDLPASSSGTGDLIKRIERRSLIVAAVAIVIAAVVPGGGLRMSAGVGGGATLALLSYWAIKRGVTGVADAVMAKVDRTAPAPGTELEPGDEAAMDPPKPARQKVPRGLGLFVLRYALLAGIAYVMIARLRLPPIGLLCGASVTMLAVAAELVRWRP